MVVWVSMLPSDNERTARRASRMFHDARVTPFFDPRQRSGRAYADEVFPNCIEEALAVLPRDHVLFAPLQERSKGPEAVRTVWDAAFFYPPEVEWGQSAPYPNRWIKQIAFQGDQRAGTGEPTGWFWQDACDRVPIESDWFIELRRMTEEFVHENRASLSP